MDHLKLRLFEFLCCMGFWARLSLRTPPFLRIISFSESRNMFHVCTSSLSFLYFFFLAVLIRRLLVVLPPAYCSLSCVYFFVSRVMSGEFGTWHMVCVPLTQLLSLCVWRLVSSAVCCPLAASFAGCYTPRYSLQDYCLVVKSLLWFVAFAQRLLGAILSQRGGTS